MKEVVEKYYLALRDLVGSLELNRVTTLDELVQTILVVTEKQRARFIGLEVENEHLSRQVDCLTYDVNDLESDLENSKDEIADLKSYIKELEAQIEDLKTK
jgi:peptidoglycan hydrolase CwlO-like protein